MAAEDPFRHHPGLRPLVAPAADSFFRTLDMDALRRQLAEAGKPIHFTPDAEREAERRAFLDALPPEALDGGDLWVFAYGSLMWDPALLFTELRRARIEGFSRRFILKDENGGRGTAERPGLFVALDAAPGAACDGLVFRIAADAIEAESFVLWRRERIAPAYLPELVRAVTDHGEVTALTFVADHAAPPIAPDLSFETQVDYCATGAGILGSSLDYLRNVARHLRELGIDDPEVARLAEAAEARAASEAP